jgi:hypothetical protein
MSEQDLWTYHDEFDRRERAGRVERNVEVVRWLSEYEGGYFSSHEAMLALSEAKDAYIYGLPLASMFASHVACERLIAGLFGMLPDDRTPKGWDRWGLSRLAQEAHIRGWISNELTIELLALAKKRRAIGHFRRPIEPDTLVRRAAEEWSLDEFTVSPITELMLSDAAGALRTAFRLAYSPDEALWRVLPE